MQDIAGREEAAEFGQPRRPTAVLRRGHPYVAQTARIESLRFDGRRALEANLMLPARVGAGVAVVLVEKGFLGVDAEVGQVKLINFTRTARRIDSVGFPSNEEAIGARVGPTKRN